MVDENPANSVDSHAAPPTPEGSSVSGRPKVVLCPYCGHAQAAQDRCEACGGLFEPMSRMATQIAMGPWFIRDKANPFRPGCSFETLERLINNGKIVPTTVIRGPSTHQFWSVARNIPGIAHLVGYCHACGAHVNPNAKECPECGAKFNQRFKRDAMGLQYPSTATVEAAQKRLLELSGAAEPEQQPQSTTDAEPAPPQTAHGDLLGQTLGLSDAGTDVASTPQSPVPQSPTPPQPAPAPPTASTKSSSTPAITNAESDKTDTPPADAKAGPHFPGQLEAYEDDSDNNPSLSPLTTGQEKSGGLSPMIWAMIILNIFVVITVGVLFFLLMQSG